MAEARAFHIAPDDPTSDSFGTHGQRWIEELPKAELHLHLEGSVSTSCG